MKKWHYDQIAPAANGCISGTLSEWPYLAEALIAQGIPMPLGTNSQALQSICRLILAERKTKFLHIPPNKELQDALLEREIYVSNDDIAETYSEYCESWAAMQWAPLDYWDDADHIGPVDYIAARVSK